MGCMGVKCNLRSCLSVMTVRITQPAPIDNSWVLTAGLLACSEAFLVRTAELWPPEKINKRSQPRNISDGLLGLAIRLHCFSPQEERLDVWFWFRKILSSITGGGQKSRLVWEPQGLALSSVKVPKRAWHGWVFPKQSCRRGEQLVELIACNFLEVIALLQPFPLSWHQKGGNRFCFFTKIISDRVCQKEKPRAETVLIYWHGPRTPTAEKTYYRKFRCPCQ